MNRSMRRHHKQRMKLKFRKRNKLHHYWADGVKSEGIYCKTKCTCSCFMCGNPRKWGKGSNTRTLTKREIIANEHLKEER